jgi:hypothetical protein
MSSILASPGCWGSPDHQTHDLEGKDAILVMVQQQGAHLLVKVSGLLWARMVLREMTMQALDKVIDRLEERDCGCFSLSMLAEKAACF